jgi:hypothetical protein
MPKLLIQPRHAIIVVDDDHPDFCDPACDHFQHGGLCAGFTAVGDSYPLHPFTPFATQQKPQHEAVVKYHRHQACSLSGVLVDLTELQAEAGGD